MRVRRRVRRFAALALLLLALVITVTLAEAGQRRCRYYEDINTGEQWRECDGGYGNYRKPNEYVPPRRPPQYQRDRTRTAQDRVGPPPFGAAGPPPFGATGPEPSVNAEPPVHRGGKW